MSRKYTAQEMRDYADAIAGDLGGNDHGGVEYFYDDLIPVIEALRQAADAMEREKKYEYAVKICFGSEEDYALDLYDDLDMAKEMAENNRKIFRREVGEWEEVSNEQG